MNELNAVRSLLSKAEAEVSARGASGVRRIFLKVGAASGVDVDLLQAVYRRCRPDTPCHGAELAVEETPTRWICPVCGDLATRPVGGLTCPVCGDPLRLDGGDELILECLELEVGDD